MKRALGHKCESKYKCLEYFWKSGNTGRVYATDAHICLAEVDNSLQPGYYDSNWQPVKAGNWIKCDIDGMYDRCTRELRPCTVERVDNVYVVDNMAFPRDQVDLLNEWTGFGKLSMSLMGVLYGESADGKRTGIIMRMDKPVYRVGPSVFLDKDKAREFAALIGVNYV